jgi:iron(III) transport system substrate-binding protein
MLKFSKAIVFCLIAIFAISCSEKKQEEQTTEAPKSEVNVYSHRHYESDQKLFEEFEKTTGIKVNIIKAGADELIEKIVSEGENSPADVLITVDAGRLFRAKEKGILQKINSEIAQNTVSANLRDPEMNWVALTKRARVIAYAKGRVKPEEIKSYEDLALPKYKGKVVMRASNNIYNQSLLASLINYYGEEKATTWAKGVVANLKQDPKGGDTDQIKNLAAGIGDLTVTNTYYYAKMLADTVAENRAIAEKVGIIFPEQAGRGTHINVSGIGLCKNAPNKENAVKLIEFLLSKSSQEVFANTEFEYPVNKEAEINAVLKGFGEFKEDTLQLDVLGKLNVNAVKVFDAAAWK